MTTDTTETTPVADEPTPAAAEPFIRVLKGNPTDADLAALIGVFACAGGGSAEPGHVDRNMWGHPVDKLRIPQFSWQQITLLERTHLRR